MKSSSTGFETSLKAGILIKNKFIKLIKLVISFSSHNLIKSFIKRVQKVKLFFNNLLQADLAVTEDTPTQSIRDTAQFAQATEHVEQTIAQSVQPTEHGDAQ